MVVLGISAFFHDSAAALIIDGQIVAAVQEERFSREKNDPEFPVQSIQYCLGFLDSISDDLDAVVFYEKPFLKFERIIETQLAFAPKGFPFFKRSLPAWIKEKLFLKRKLIQFFQTTYGPAIDWEKKIHFSEHHLSHAASAFFPSPFENAAILTIDGVGEYATTSIHEGKNTELQEVKRINFPHSLGLLYSGFTQHLGFAVNSGEYKVMGLAPYGQPKYQDIIRSELLDQFDDGSFKLNLEFFGFCTSLSTTNKKFEKIIPVKPRRPGQVILQDHMDLAASIQCVAEDIIINLARHAKEVTKAENLCLAGGVALNCVANGRILNEAFFEDIWVQPAAGDAGASIGAALAYYYRKIEDRREVAVKRNTNQSLFLGPEYKNTHIQKCLEEHGLIYKKLENRDQLEETAISIASGKVVGWFDGRLEFGPRALGSRSILADPRDPEMQKRLNLKIKFREGFRPFAPSVLEEHQKDWFELSAVSEGMQFVTKVKETKLIDEVSMEETKGFDLLHLPRSVIPAVTHVDNSARVQTVTKTKSPRFYDLISRFFALTGCPIVINTSFNVRGEPIVCSPNDAINCFLSTDMDLLSIGGFLVSKEDQAEHTILNSQSKFKED